MKWLKMVDFKITLRLSAEATKRRRMRRLYGGSVVYREQGFMLSAFHGRDF
jgi:hypothetical protein